MWAKFFGDVVVIRSKPFSSSGGPARMMGRARRLNVSFVDSIANPHKKLVALVTGCDCLGKLGVVEVGALLLSDITVAITESRQTN